MSHRYATLRSIARKTLKEYDHSLLTGEPRAVPIEAIAEKHFGLCIEYHCLRKNGLVLGATIFDDTYLPIYDTENSEYTLIEANAGTIVLDESLLNGNADGRLRFTCAHEVAHWLIHKELYKGSGQAAALVNRKTSLEEDCVVERQANVLGTALLLPVGQVKKAFYEYRRTQPRQNAACSLATLFGVSRQAMSIYLKDHGLT